MRIAVTTPTGNVGRHVLRMLVRAGVRPVALMRDPSRLDPELVPLVEVRRIDQFDADSVVAATRGIDHLFWVVPSTAGEDPLTDYARAAAAISRAVARNGIRRVVLQSSIGAELRHGAGEIDGLAANEVVLDASGADVAHLRCGYFFTNLLLDPDAIRAGLLEVLLPLDAPLAFVAPRDVAEVATGRLLSEWSGRIVQAVHGPVDLTWPEAAAIVSDAIGSPLRVERIPDGVMRARLRSSGASEAFAAAIMGMSTGMRDDFLPEQPRSIASTTPTGLGGWAYDHLRPLL